MSATELVTEFLLAAEEGNSDALRKVRISRSFLPKLTR